MRFSAIALFATGALASTAPAGTSPLSGTKTDVVTGYTTYCAAPTTLSVGGSTVPVATPGTVTVPGTFTVVTPYHVATKTVCTKCVCPCSATGTSGTGTAAPSGAAAIGSTGTAVSGLAPTASGTAFAGRPKPTGPPTNGASRVAGVSAGLAGLVAVVALVL